MSFQKVQVDIAALPNRHVWRSFSNSGWGHPFSSESTVHPMGEEDFAESYARALREYDDAASRLDALRIIRQQFSEVNDGR